MFSRFFSSLSPRGNSNRLIIPKGTGGRSSLSDLTVSVFGCTGAIGTYLTPRLGRSGSMIIAPYRCDSDEIRHLKLSTDLGRFVPIFFDPKIPESYRPAIRHVDVVYNLIGEPGETRNYKYKDFVESARLIGRMAREEGVAKVIYTSALSARLDSRCDWLRMKAESEEATKQEFPGATIVRLGQVFGYNDRFLRRIADIKSTAFGGFPVVNDGKRKVRPVHMEDVGIGLANLAADPLAEGKVFEFYGKEYTYAQVLDIFMTLTGRTFRVVNLPENVYRLRQKLLSKLRVVALSDVWEEESERMFVDDVVDESAMGLSDVGISEPQLLEHTAIEFLRKYRKEEEQEEPISERV